MLLSINHYTASAENLLEGRSFAAIIGAIMSVTSLASVIADSGKIVILSNHNIRTILMPPRTPSSFSISRSRSSCLFRHQTYRCLSCSIRLSQSASVSTVSASNEGSTTHFGHQSIPSSTKSSRVASVFSSVATSYDTMNDLMSLGLHRLWKDRFVSSLSPGSFCPSTSWTMLDVAGGTGDIAFRLLDHATLLKNDESSKVIVSDINPAMLALGQKRALQTPYADSSPSRLEWLEADAEALPPGKVPDQSIDLYTVAFGIRNFTSPARALAEAYRVLKPGGVFACLEFSQVSNRLFNALYKKWSFSAIPMMGQLVAGDRDSYQYLVESIERFPSQRDWETIIKGAGFLVPRREGEEGEERGWEDLMGGVAAIHKGIKPLK